MSDRIIRIEIGLQDQAETITTKGYSGRECVKATEFLQDRQTVTDTPTAEMGKSCSVEVENEK